ncbi:DUF4747 family protein [Rufibacter immobilis]|uniref:DUF4747 family protein n=1 Tax=Rufibacter immobilis TaxID=1348778 RepID=A0A3M9N3B9_9BACT|nr:DUF4747 family protein [Rufibacter immobilis]RNI32249.1 DUF4747 family protein [Rufibacter immobilis]
MANQQRPQVVRLWVLNIKLRSNTRKGPSAYEELITELYKLRLSPKVRGGSSIILRTQFKESIDGKAAVYYGKISRFTRLDSTEWFDSLNMEVVNHEIPAGLFPNLKETEYFFIPSAHRFCILDKAGTISLTNAEDYLKKVLPNVIFEDEDFEVNVEQDINSFEEILYASEIKKLVISITYSNNDTNDELTAFVDNELRALRVGKLDATITPDQTGQLSLDDSPFIKGALGVAESDGTVEATIVDQEGVKKKVSTRNYPRKIFVENIGGDDAVNRSVFSKIMSIFRQ